MMPLVKAITLNEIRLRVGCANVVEHESRLVFLQLQFDLVCTLCLQTLRGSKSLLFQMPSNPHSPTIHRSFE